MFVQNYVCYVALSNAAMGDSHSAFVQYWDWLKNEDRASDISQYISTQLATIWQFPQPANRSDCDIISHAQFDCEVEVGGDWPGQHQRPGGNLSDFQF